MKQALVALENGKRVRACEGGTKYQPELEEAAMTALRQAIKEDTLEGLAETSRDIEQEPVAWMHMKTNQVFTNQPPPSLESQCQPLFTAPMSTKQENIDTKTEHVDGVDIEPVAWMQADQAELYVKEWKDEVQGYTIPLYLAPPKRGWVSLDATDCRRIRNETERDEREDVIELTEKILKEKNNG
jgi:hypothetical protein